MAQRFRRSQSTSKSPRSVTIGSLRSAVRPPNAEQTNVRKKSFNGQSQPRSRSRSALEARSRGSKSDSKILRSPRRPSCRKKMIAYYFFQHGYVATKRRGKKNQRRIGSARQLDLTVKRRDPNAPIRVALDDFRCPATVTCSRAFAGLACLMP